MTARFSCKHAAPGELENKLQTQPAASPLSDLGLASSIPSITQPSILAHLPTPPTSAPGFLASPPTFSQSASTSPPAPSPNILSLSPTQDINHVFRQFPDTATPGEAQHRASFSIPTPAPSSSDSSLPGLDMMDPAWPPNIPGKELLSHLVDTFFACCPHANRVLHRPSFMAILLEPPTSDKFP